MSKLVGTSDMGMRNWELELIDFDEEARLWATVKSLSYPESEPVDVCASEIDTLVRDLAGIVSDSSDED